MRLNTQISEYDCGTTSLLNAIRVLFKRDEIPVEILKIVYKYTLDCKYKIIGDCGTTKKAMKKVVKKINKYGNKHNFDLSMQYVKSINCDIEKIKTCIYKKEVVIVRSFLEVEHYYLITNIDQCFLYIWDPYLINDSYTSYNMKLEIDKIDNESKENYALGPLKEREFIVVKRNLF